MIRFHSNYFKSLAKLPLVEEQNLLNQTLKQASDALFKSTTPDYEYLWKPL